MKDKLARGEKWAQQVGIDTAQWESTTPLESIKQVIEPVFKNTDLHTWDPFAQTEAF